MLCCFSHGASLLTQPLLCLPSKNTARFSTGLLGVSCRFLALIAAITSLSHWLGRLFGAGVHIQEPGECDKVL